MVWYEAVAENPEKRITGEHVKSSPIFVKKFLFEVFYFLVSSVSSLFYVELLITHYKLRIVLFSYLIEHLTLNMCEGGDGVEVEV